jgi:hypothetical protein
MKTNFKTALKIFKYLAVIFTILFWIYMIYDDYIFVEKYGITMEGIGMWFMWYLVYFMGFTFYFWTISSIIILIKNKIIKQKK